MGNYANGSVGDSYGMIYTINKKFKFRSPLHNCDDGVFFVVPGGAVYGDGNYVNVVSYGQHPLSEYH